MAFTMSISLNDICRNINQNFVRKNNNPDNGSLKQLKIFFVFISCYEWLHLANILFIKGGIRFENRFRNLTTVNLLKKKCLHALI